MGLVGSRAWSSGIDVSIVDVFERFAADFEDAVRDDNWLRLEKYFAKDATYQNLEGPDATCKGCDAILAYFKNDVTNTDRKFDTRRLIALRPPVAEEDRLSRRWRCTYTLTGVPDLVLEGESRYLFEGDLIKSLDVELTEESMQTLNDWMQKNSSKLKI